MSNISRRAVLGGGAGAAALVVLGVEAAPASASTATVPPVRAHYAKSIGKAFTAVQAGHTYRVTLAAIRDAVPARAKDKPYAFTLVFTPARGTHLHEGVYRLARRGVRTHSLFLSSVGSGGAMQAAVNRAPR